MIDALHPLRRAYGVAAPDAPEPSPGTPGHVEAVLLGQTREAIEHLRPAAPEAATVDAVLAYAAAGPAVAAGLDHELAALPTASPVRPDAPVLARIEAFAADATLAAVRSVYGEAVGDADVASPTEAALLDGARELLGRGPRLRPAAAVLAAVTARAEEASVSAPDTADAAPTDPALASLAAAYGLPLPSGATPAAVETALLTDLRDVLAGAPRVRPSDAVRDAILAQAAAVPAAPAGAEAPVTELALLPIAAAYGLPIAGTPAGVEMALLQSTRDVLDRAPRLRPTDVALAAITARAAEASGVPAVASRPAPPRAITTDRAPVALVAAAATPGSARRTGLWAGSAGLVSALLLALVLLPRPGADGVDASESVATVASVDGGATAEATPPEGVPAEEAMPLVASAEPPPPSAGAAETETPSLAASATPARASVPRPAAEPRAEVAARSEALADRVAAPSVREAASSAPAAQARTPAPRSAPPASGLSLASASRPAPETAPSSWDAADSDVRVLSLRLRELRRGNRGTDWDAPAQALGTPQDPVTMSATPGLQSIRAGAAPGRARLRTDTFPTGD